MLDAILFSILTLAGPPPKVICASCPEGCIARALVESFREVPLLTPRACPDNCVPTEVVKALLDEPPCSISSAPAKPPLAPDQSGDRVGTTQDRTIAFNTALPAPPGEVVLTGYAAALWNIQYSINEHFQVGSYIVLPLYLAGVMPNFKVQFALSDNFSIGGGGMIGIGGPYVDAGPFLFLLGGHVEFTLHTGNHILNLALSVIGAGTRANGADFQMADSPVFLPNIGYRYAFHPNWSLQIEITRPFTTYQQETEFYLFMLYGVRGHGDLMFGDIGFLMPLWDDYITDVWKYTPLGIPYFSLGFKI